MYYHWGLELGVRVGVALYRDGMWGVKEGLDKAIEALNLKVTIDTKVPKSCTLHLTPYSLNPVLSSKPKNPNLRHCLHRALQPSALTLNP